jgi:hypothetical protein
MPNIPTFAFSLGLIITAIHAKDNFTPGTGNSEFWIAFFLPPADFQSSRLFSLICVIGVICGFVFPRLFPTRGAKLKSLSKGSLSQSGLGWETPCR